MLKYEGVIWGFIILGIVYVFVNSELGKSLILKFGKSGIELNISKETPPRNIPESASEKIQIEPKIVSPTISSKENFQSIDVAYKKPVIYIPKRIITSEGEWDRDSYYERYSVNKGNYPSNLTDGNPKTVAYPASWFLDYIIDLEGLYKIYKIDLVWENFGIKNDAVYITSWKLLVQKEMPGDKKPDEKDWQIIESRDYLNEKVTTIDLDSPIIARRFRIYAESIDRQKKALLNWIGIYEFKAWARKEKK